MIGPQSGEEGIRPKLVQCVRDTSHDEGLQQGWLISNTGKGLHKSENKRMSDRQTDRQTHHERGARGASSETQLGV